MADIAVASLVTSIAPATPATHAEQLDLPPPEAPNAVVPFTKPLDLPSSVSPNAAIVPSTEPAPVGAVLQPAALGEIAHNVDDRWFCSS